jgi:hypothetical protein
MREDEAFLKIQEKVQQLNPDVKEKKLIKFIRS